ncbi:MAG: hypothetical protein KAR07_09160, partial [Spirochaetes bacterium]|nr:hypothetical protein [Spirochaetota bacterium]
FERNLDKEPVYGIFNEFTIPEITGKIDWAILHDYIQIEYDYRLPLLYHTHKGWQIARQVRVKELIKQFNDMLASDSAEYNMAFLKDRNRELIFELLEEIRNINDKKYIPLLKAWEEIDYKKVKSRIGSVLRDLEK